MNAVERAEVVQHPDVVSFLAARMDAQLRYRMPRCWGISSDALALYGVGHRTEVTPGSYPADQADLDACERTWLMAPDEVRARMLPVLERYRAHVAQRWAR